MLTSGDLGADTERCREVGIAARLMKPTKQSELFDTMQAVLGLSAEGSPRPAEPEAAVCARPLRILLAEDSVINQRVACALLGRQGHVVTVASNGRHAVEKSATGNFDVVLMDVQMPELDGFEATAAIRAREKQTGEHLPIIAMTAHAIKGDRERCLEAGMDDYVSKPIQVTALYKALARIMPRDAGESTDVAPVAVVAADADNSGASPLLAEETIDWEAAISGLGGDESLLREVIAVFLDECPKLLKELRAAVEGQDAARARLVAHTLKGSIMLFGADEIVAAAHKLESWGQERDLVSLRAALPEFEARLNGLARSLGKFAVGAAPVVV
jgi:two-component system sensor histidine kinase/response regulator